MIVWAGAAGPMEFPICLDDRDIVYAGLAPEHQTGIVKPPLFVSICPEPLTLCVMVFILESRGDLVSVKRPDLLD